MKILLLISLVLGISYCQDVCDGPTTENDCIQNTPNGCSCKWEATNCITDTCPDYSKCIAVETDKTECVSNSDCDILNGQRCNDRSINDGSWKELTDTDSCDTNCKCYCVAAEIASFGFEVNNLKDFEAEVSDNKFAVTLFWDGRMYQCENPTIPKTREWYNCDSIIESIDESGTNSRKLFFENIDKGGDGLWIAAVQVTDDVHGRIEFSQFCTAKPLDELDWYKEPKSTTQCTTDSFQNQHEWDGICMDATNCLGGTNGIGTAADTYPIMELDLSEFGTKKEVGVVVPPDSSYQKVREHAVMRCREDADYTNDFKQTINNVQTDYFVSGVNSVHSSNHEDRRFKWRYCRQTDVPFISTSVLTTTALDGEWNMKCPTNSAIIGGESSFSGTHNDRDWAFSCGHLDTTQYVLTECVDTGYKNEYDLELDYDCPDNGVIAGVQSIHSSANEDRKYGFTCCRITFPVCDANTMATFDWNELLKDGTGKPTIEYTLDDDPADLSLNIEVKLTYEGHSSANGNGAKYGTTYVLDFEDYNAHKDKISEPGTCQNRNENSYSGKTFDEYWDYSPEPLTAGNLGSTQFLAYPPPDPKVGSWSISMDEQDGCGTVVYKGKFTWNDLKGCTPYNDGNTMYVETKTNAGANTLELSGTFYVNVVSPYHYEGDMGGIYRVYQLLSAPFVISVSKSVYVLGSTGINLLLMSIIAVYKEDNENTFRLIVLTESADYLELTRSGPELFNFQPSADNQGNLDKNAFSALQFSTSKDYKDGVIDGCLNNKGNICSQLWEITASDVNCNGNDQFIDFSGTYSIQFEPSCRAATSGLDQKYVDYCDIWLNGDGTPENPAHLDSITTNGKVLLETELFWKDMVCTPQVFEEQFTASMDFYIDDQFVDSSRADDTHLYQVGSDTIYVQITTDFPTATFDVFDTKLIAVWICTFDPTITPDTIGADTASGGCFDTDKDDTEFNHIFQLAPELIAYEFDNKGHPDTNDDTKNQLRFSFNVPQKVTRDKLYIHAQIEVTLSNGNRRRLIAIERTANQMDHFIDNVGVGNKPNDNNKPKQPIYNEPQQPQQPYNNIYNQPQTPQQPIINPSVLSLSSPWIIALGGFLGLILTFNIIFMCYMNFCKDNNDLRRRTSFNRRRRSGYSSVKVNDSEIDQQELNAINVVSE